MSAPIKMVAEGVLFGVDAYVAKDGAAYVTNRGTLRGLRGKNAEENAGTGIGDLGRTLARLPNSDALLAVAPVSLSLPKGGTALGRPAQWFVDVLRAYKTAWREGKLHSSQVHLAENADRILDALAGVAFVALIHEAANFEAQRERGLLLKLYGILFRPTPAPWERMFDDSLVSALCRLDGIPWEEGTRHPVHLASTNEKIYALLFGSEAGKELQRRNPVPHFGKNHHQTLTAEAQAYLRGELAIVKAIANQSASKADFWRRLERHYRCAALQLDMLGTEPEPAE